VNPPHDHACDAVQDDLPELALGALTGRDRAVALAHVETCHDCSALLERLSFSADRLLDTGEVVEPPVGFESRVYDRLGWTRRPSGWRCYLQFPGLSVPVLRAGLALASAAVVASIGFGAGWIGHPGSTSLSPAGLPRSAARALTTAQLVADGESRGEVFVSKGHPAWLLMNVEDAGGSGPVTCTVTTASGARVTIGTFQLSSGYGVWGGSLPVSPGELRTLSVAIPGGATVATAAFR
jgi:hypothetical protein